MSALKKLGFFAAAALYFGSLPFLDGLPFVASSLLLVAMGVLMAAAASGSFSAIAIACGALAAFGGTALRPVAPAVAGALMVALVFAERTLRVRVQSARLVHLGIALVGGALAGQLSASFSASNLAIFGVSVVVGTALSALPLLLDADDPLAYSLDQAASLLPEPSRAALKEAAELKRNVADVPLDKDAAESVHRTWDSLLRLGEARARLERTQKRGPNDAAKSVVAMVDQKIQGHVDALRKAFTAADTMKAFVSASDDSALDHIAATGDSLEEVSRVLAEMDEEPGRVAAGGGRVG